MKKMLTPLTMKNLPLYAMKNMLPLFATKRMTAFAISTVMIGIATHAATFEKATTLTNGRYILVINENGTPKIATPTLSGSTYGTMPLIAAAAESATYPEVSPQSAALPKSASSSQSADFHEPAVRAQSATLPSLITADEAYAFTITVSGSTLTIQDDESNYYGMASGHHLSIFMLYDAENDGCSYTYAINPSTAAVTLTNLANPSCILCQTPSSKAAAPSLPTQADSLSLSTKSDSLNLPSQYDSSCLSAKAGASDISAEAAASWNNYLAPAQSPTTYNLPTLYRQTDNATITEIPADSTADDPTDPADSSNRAPVTYYNLQGQRIPAPIPGLYLRLQGTKVENAAPASSGRRCRLPRLATEDVCSWGSVPRAIARGKGARGGACPAAMAGNYFSSDDLNF
jgi:hypothetical protein